MKNVVRIWFSLLCLFLAGCRAPSVNSSFSESHNSYAGHLVSDSVIIRDSIFLHESADTVFLTRCRTLYRERLLRDTIVHCDTIYRERVVTQPSQENKSRIHWWFLLLVLLFLWRTGILSGILNLVKNK